MSKSDQTPAVPLSLPQKKTPKVFYEHGKDALELALSVADIQEEKALRKAVRRHQLQVAKPRAGQNDRNHASHRKSRLEEAKLMLTKQRTEAKKEKARARKEFKSRLRKRDDAITSAPEDPLRATPRKRVSFTLNS